MIHPDTELRPVSPSVGVGIFATRLIPLGTITWVLDPLDQVFAPGMVDDLPPAYRPLIEKYSFRDESSQFILCWDHARYVNHSCDPNCAGTRHGFDVAVRDIAVGEQLTNDYATLNLMPHESFDCACGAATCRRWVTPESPDAARDAQRDAVFGAALGRLRSVEQPLWTLAETRLEER